MSEEIKKLPDEKVEAVSGGRADYEGGPNFTLAALQYYFPSDKCHMLVQLIENELSGSTSLETAKQAFLETTLNLNYMYFRNIYIYATGNGESPYIS